MAISPDPKSERSQAHLYLPSEMPKNTKTSCQSWWTGYMRVTGVLWWKQLRRTREDMPFYSKRSRTLREGNGMREY
jgi:hypothetical protein